MISRKQWAVLLFVYILYLFLGGTVFMYTERNNEVRHLRELHKEQRQLTLKTSLIEDETLKYEIKDIVRKLEDMVGESLFLPDKFGPMVNEEIPQLKRETNISIPIISKNTTISDLIISGRFHDLLKNGATTENGVNETVFEVFWEEKDIDEQLVEKEAMWTMYNSFFFSFQTITTIGFGQMSPKTNIGKSFCLAYSIFGVPFNGIVFASLADLFSRKFVKKIDNKRYELKLMIVLDVVLYLIPGILIFFVFPAAVFMLVEGWSYLSSFYYVFVTLSTIGFGDMVSGYVNLQPAWLWAYRIFIHGWIIFGLGYLLMIITFIQSALRSKQLRILDRKMAKLLKHKASRRTANLQKDLDKLRLLLKAIIVQQDRSNKIYNIEEEKGGNIEDKEEKEPDSKTEAKDNFGYEDDEGLIMNNKNLGPPKPNLERKTSKEMDSIEIFLQLAANVLKENDRRELMAKVSMKNEESEKSAATQKKKESNNNLKKNYSTGNLHQEQKSKAAKENSTKAEKEGPEGEPARKMSLKRRLSAWRLNYLASTSNDTDSQTESSQEEDDENDEHEKDSDEIEDFGDLIDKVEKIISQDIKDTDETTVHNRSIRSRSLGTIVTHLK